MNKSKIKCLYPFTYVEMTKKGVFPCCSSWTKMEPLGDVRKESLMDIWNGERYQYLRGKMYRHEFKDVCEEKSCPFMISGSMVDLDKLNNGKYFISDEILDDIRNGRTKLSSGPSRITMSDSGACNLRCIMCGSGRNYRNEDEEVSRLGMDEVKKILPYLREVRLTGDGDPFFRRDTRELLETFDPVKYPNVEFIILTNGQMLTQKMWEKIKHNNISQIWVSVDAARKETYEKIRVGGNWEKLLMNLLMISDIRKKGGIKFFEINMTVMRSNYKEIIEFLHLGEKLNCDQVALQRFYGDMPARENIFDPPNNKILLSIKEIFKDPVFKNVKVWMEGLADVKDYNFSIADRFNYSKHFISVKVRKLYDRHIAWRFK